MLGGFGLLLLCGASAPLAQEQTLVVSLQDTTGGALYALDPLSGAYKLLASWPQTDLAGVAGSASGAVYVLDAGLDTRPARVLRVDPDADTWRTVSAGGSLRDPRQCAELPNGELLVVDREALGGTGALLRIDVASGRQRLVSFGALFVEPSDLLVDPAGAVLVLDHLPILVDALTGQQRALPSPAAPFARPIAFEPLADGNALVCDGGTLLRLDLRNDTATPVVVLPRTIRDFTLDADGTAFCLWGDGSEGGVLRAFADGTSVPLVRGAGLADVRGLALVPALDLSGSIGGEEPAPPVVAPDRPVLPPVSIEVRAQTVTLLHGPGALDDVVLPAGPYPLVTALRAATPGSDPVLGVFGDIPGSAMSIGGGDSDQKAYVAHWGPVPMRFAVVGMTPDARIREFSVWQKMNDGTVNGGVVDALFQDLTIEARYSQCVGAPKGHAFGLLRFYGCRFEPDRESLAQGGYGGYGYKWGIRAQGRGRWDLRGCSFAPVQEHAVYIDSPQGDCVFLDLEHNGSTRTAIQVVNRSRDNPGPSGFGTLLFEDVRIRGLWGDGGSGITVAGHLGDLVFRDIVAREDLGQPGSHGGIVVWVDAALHHGTYLHRAADGRLYSTGRVTIESTDLVLPHADRPLVAISGAEDVRIQGFSAEGGRVLLNLDSPFGVAEVSGLALVDGVEEVLERADIRNGRVSFALPCPLSFHPGFRGSAKIQVGTRLLSDLEIDQLWCWP